MASYLGRGRGDQVDPFVTRLENSIRIGYYVEVAGNLSPRFSRQHNGSKLARAGRGGKRKPEMAPLSFRATQGTDAIQTRAAAPTPSFHCRNFHLEKPRKRKNGGNSKMGFPVRRCCRRQRPTAPTITRATTPLALYGATAWTPWYLRRRGVIFRLDHFVIQPEPGRAVCHRHPVPVGGPMFLSIIHWSERSKSRIASNGENCPHPAAPSPDPARARVGSSGKSCHVHRPSAAAAPVAPNRADRLREHNPTRFGWEHHVPGGLSG